MPNLGIIFTTGLLAGGVSCLAVQGGLLATAVAQNQESGSKNYGAWATAIFLLAKLAAYTLLGLGLGVVGSVLTMTPLTRALFQGLAAIYMLGVGLALLDVHPFFRRFLITPPRFLTRAIRKQSKSASLVTPAILGLMTVFIPCGVTQAMMALAIASGNPGVGAAIMAVFVIGTMPLFAGLGVVMAKLGEGFGGKFRRAGAWLVTGIAVFSLNSALVLTGSPVTAQKVLAMAECSISICDRTVVGETVRPADEVTITFLKNRYEVDNPNVKAGSKVKLNLVNKGGYGCIQAFEFPDVGVSEVVSPGRSKSIEVEIPRKSGELAFFCAMGMYSGQLTVVN